MKEELNVKLLLRVKEHILTYPEQVNMNVPLNTCGTTGCIAGWIVSLGSPEAVFNIKVTLQNLTATQEEERYNWCDLEEVAQNLLRITEGSDISDSLFYHERWPEDLLREYYIVLTGDEVPNHIYPYEPDSLGSTYAHNELLAKLSSERRQELAKIIAQAIDRFIEKYGSENNDCKNGN